tara:strand:- start:651 stop:1313 length:663 start_codon:yes stop_codon:yes gene_type:complete
MTHKTLTLLNSIELTLLLRKKSKSKKSKSINYKIHGCTLCKKNATVIDCFGEFKTRFINKSKYLTFGAQSDSNHAVCSSCIKQCNFTQVAALQEEQRIMVGYLKELTSIQQNPSLEYKIQCVKEQLLNIIEEKDTLRKQVYAVCSSIRMPKKKKCFAEAELKRIQKLKKKIKKKMKERYITYSALLMEPQFRQLLKYTLKEKRKKAMMLRNKIREIKRRK